MSREFPSQINLVSATNYNDVIGSDIGSSRPITSLIDLVYRINIQQSGVLGVVSGRLLTDVIDNIPSEGSSIRVSQAINNYAYGISYTLAKDSNGNNILDSSDQFIDYKVINSNVNGFVLFQKSVTAGTYFVELTDTNGSSLSRTSSGILFDPGTLYGKTLGNISDPKSSGGNSNTTLAIAPTNASQTEGNLGNKAFTFTVTRSGSTTGTNAVNWTVTETGTNAANAADFGGTLPSGNVTFAAGETSKIITINVKGDITQEANETFSVRLSNPSNGATLTTATATGTIQNDDFIGNSSNNSLTGTTGNDYINGGGGADTLTGLAGADTFVFQFGQSPVSGADRITDFAIGSDKIDLLTSLGVAMNAPTAFTRAANSTATTLTNVINSVFTDANGALTGNQALGVNSAALVSVTTSGIAGTYLVINDGVADFQSSNDLLVNITGYSGTLPALGTIAVSSFFI